MIYIGTGVIERECVCGVVCVESSLHVMRSLIRTPEGLLATPIEYHEYTPCINEEGILLILFIDGQVQQLMYQRGGHTYY